MVKSRYIGDGKNPTFNRNPYNGYINPYYWVDDHPLLYGNNGSLDPGTYIIILHIFLPNLRLDTGDFETLGNQKMTQSGMDILQIPPECNFFILQDHPWISISSSRGHYDYQPQKCTFSFGNSLKITIGRKQNICSHAPPNGRVMTHDHLHPLPFLKPLIPLSLASASSSNNISSTISSTSKASGSGRQVQDPRHVNAT